MWNGNPPSKYTRLIPFIGHGDVLELGSAEGVLSLLLAGRQAGTVIALERNEARHAEALRLRERWHDLGRCVNRCHFIRADIRDRIDLLQECEVFVAVRSIYYLRESLDDVFAEIAKHPRRVVLCGNPGRARRYERGALQGDGLGHFNFYASIPGMVDLVTRHGYHVESTVPQGDPIVVAVR